jgi:phosphoglycolate phosphatase-like HAD superfamily hydrolase
MKKTMKQRILFDLDGVIANTAAAVMEEVNQELKLQIKHADLTNWLSIYEIVFEQTGSKEKAEWAINRWFDPGVVAKAQVTEGAKRGERLS